MLTEQSQRFDIIWNITRLCPWDCAVCCVDAHHVVSKEHELRISSNQLNVVQPRTDKSPSQQATDVMRAMGLELDLSAKKRVIDHCDGLSVRFDFSGGDPLFSPDTLEVMRYAAERVGPENITLTATGPGFARYAPEVMAPLVSEINFTYDAPRRAIMATRPKAYSDSNLGRVIHYHRAGIRIRAECPLTIHNCDPKTIRRIYEDLAAAGVDLVLVMRLFSVGRGTAADNFTPSAQQYRAAIAAFREAEAEIGGPKVKLQCALRFFDNGDSRGTNPCDLVRASFGLMPDGVFLASAWAYDSSGGPLGEEWVLGRLDQTPLIELLASQRVRELYGRLDENFGHCKVFAWSNSRRTDGTERMLDKADPLLLI